MPAAAAQVSPLIPGAQPLEGLEAASLAGAVVAAPPGAIERRYVLARVLRALAPGAPLVALAPGAKGGARLGKELAAFGCEVAESGRRHYRICQTVRPETPTGLQPALEAGALRFDEALGLWTQPGVFSWNRPDPGTGRLLAALTPLAGAGADLGCGPGAIARALLARETVTRLALVDIDARAIAAARRNVDDPRATFHWADVRAGSLELSGLDFVVMNPPFHDGGAEDRELGQAFIRRAHGMLRRGGALWLVANRHLPYEAALRLFAQVTPRGDSGGYKLYEARR